MLQHRAWELRPPNRDDEALNLVLYTNEELKAILGDPRHQIGAGGFSSVFKGKLPDGEVTVAVKCPREDRSVGGVLETLSKEMVHRQQHPHILQLLGYCRHPPALLYEFMENGDLESYLKSPDLRS